MKTEFKVGNIKIGELNILKGKEQFTVSDLIKILNKLNQDAQIIFGVATKKSTSFCQNENFIFRLRYQDREAEWDENYTVDIITDGKCLEKL
jgi:hypothetical protein